MEIVLDTKDKVFEYVGGDAYRQHIAEVRNEGMALGKGKLNNLYYYLTKNKLTDDLFHAIEDEDYREKLFIKCQDKLKL